MSQQRLSWESESNVLRLQGELMADTLLPVWQQREALMQTCQYIDVSGLSRVDSAGLALLVHLRHLRVPALAEIKGITDKLDTLITLYNLHPLMTTAA